MASRASSSRPAITCSPIGPSTTPSKNRRRSVESAMRRSTSGRISPRNRASRPNRAGMMVSRRVRRMRARMGAAPPVETAATRGERSRIEGRMNEHSGRRSTALTGMPRSRAAAATALASASSSSATITSRMPSRSRSRNARRCHVTSGLAGQLAQPRGEIGGDDHEPSAGTQQKSGLGLGSLRPAHEQAGLAPDGEEDRQIVHGSACLAVHAAPGRPFERPDRVRSSAVQGAADRACESRYLRGDGVRHLVPAGVH